MDWLNPFKEKPGVTIDGRIVPIAIRRHPTAKRLTMRVASDGSEIRVTMPRWGQSREATAFAAARLCWIEAQLKAARTADPPGNGSNVPFNGRMLTVVWDAQLPRAPRLHDTGLRLGGPEASIVPRIERWLREAALTHMQADLHTYCDRAGVAAPGLALSRAKRRWGSCSTSGTVRVNWRLIMAPEFVRRSVVAHEVAHLVHFNHSAAFHAVLADIYESDLPAANRWLKTKGRDLYRYFG